MDTNKLKIFLDQKVDEHNRPSFIAGDPISIPHQFTRREDIEIAGFFAAIFSWGNRTTIIRKSNELMDLMGRQPYRFCLDPSPGDLKRLLGFRHRTFNDTDLLYFVEFFRMHYFSYPTLEDAFTMHGTTIEEMLTGFHHYFFSLEDAPRRTRKHISTPEKKATCKRLNMFLRWMVRNDGKGVDFGIWKNIHPSQLIIPIDVHVARVAHRLKLLHTDKTNWHTALKLTGKLRQLDPSDPAKYDFALFSIGAVERYQG